MNRDSTVDCSKRDSLPDMSFRFGGRDYKITAHDYIMELGSGGQAQCISSFTGLDIPEPLGESTSTHGARATPLTLGATGPIWIVGDTFLRKWYTVYDMDRAAVGFAKAK